jgi:hypothetical protein
VSYRGTVVIRRLPTGEVEVSDVIYARGPSSEGEIAVYNWSSPIPAPPTFGTFADAKIWLREHEQRGFTFTRKP